MKTSIAYFKNVHVSYRDHDVLKDINLIIESGQHTAILGPNGAGKTTLIRLFARDLYPVFREDSQCLIFGREQWNVWDLREYLGIITHDLHKKLEQYGDKLTAYEAVLAGFYSSLGVYKNQTYTDAQRKKAEDILDILHIRHLRDRTVQKLSTGEIRRVVIGRALVHDPRAVLLDEPTTGLDIRAQVEFTRSLRQLAGHTTLILVTHHIEEIIPEIDNIILLKEGRIYQQGSKHQVLSEEHLSHTFSIPLTLEKKGDRFRFLY